MIVRRSRLSVGSVSVRVVCAVGAAVALCLGLVPARAQNNGSKPVAHDRSVRVIQGKPKVVKLKGKASSAGQKDMTFEVTGFPQHGSLTTVDGEKGKVTYEPDAGFSGEDRFTFTVHDGVATSDPAVVILNVYKRGDAWCARRTVGAAGGDR